MADHSAEVSQPRTEINRLKHKVRHELSEVHAILDAATVGHLSWVEEDFPYIIPTAYVRDGDSILIHGSTGAGGLRAAAAGSPVAFAVTILDGYVLARSAFESSMQYRSVVVHGSCTVVQGAEKSRALVTITEGLFPGRSSELRLSTAKEEAATLMLKLTIEKWSCKVSAAEPEDLPEDMDAQVWAGVVPVRTTLGTPVPASNLAQHLHTPPPYLAQWTR